LMNESNANCLRTRPGNLFCSIDDDPTPHLPVPA
jgi:hypothetical protein